MDDVRQKTPIRAAVSVIISGSSIGPNSTKLSYDKQGNLCRLTFNHTTLYLGPNTWVFLSMRCEGFGNRGRGCLDHISGYTVLSS